MTRARNKTIMFSLYLIASVVVLCVHAVSEENKSIDAKDIFKTAAAFYEDTRYDEAIKEYEKLLASGVESGHAHYNIANCYFKKDELGRAILNYERAKRLMPKDSDLRSNYEYALSKAEKDHSAVQYKNVFIRINNKIFEGFTLDGMTLFLSSLWLLIVICLGVSMFMSDMRTYMFILIGISIMLMLTGAIEFKERRDALNSESIIVDKAAEARFAPFDTGTVYFKLLEGDKVYIIDSKDDWCRVKRPDGKLGWVKSSSLELI